MTAQPKPQPAMRRGLHPLEMPNAPSRPPKAAEPVQALNARVPAALHRRVRFAAVEQGRTVAAIVAEALAEWLDRHGG